MVDRQCCIKVYNVVIQQIRGLPSDHHDKRSCHRSLYNAITIIIGYIPSPVYY